MISRKKQPRGQTGKDKTPAHGDNRGRESETEPATKKIEIWLESTSFYCWEKIGSTEGLTNDTQIAEFLIQQYGTVRSEDSPVVVCVQCDGPLTMLCVRCQPQFKPKDMSQTFQGDDSDNEEDADFKLKRTFASQLEAEKEPSCPVTERNGTIKSQNLYGSLAGHELRTEDRSAKTPVYSQTLNMAKTCLKSVVTTAENENKQSYVPSEHLHTCVQCGKVYMNLDVLKRHEDRIHTKDKNLSPESPTFSSDLNTIKSLHSQLPGVGYSSKQKCRTSVAKDPVQYPFACDECERVYKRPDSLRNHKREHKKAKQLSAETNSDNKATDSVDAQNLGIVSALEENLKKYKCEKCGQNYAHYASLYRHRRSHEKMKLSGEKNLDSQNTANFGKTSSELGLITSEVSNNLSISLPESGKLKKHCCKQCGRVFKYRKSLLRHEELHRQAKSLHLKLNTNGLCPCEECGKEFRSVSLLLRHRKQHLNNGVKPFICTVCGKAFKVGSSLEYHKWIHFPELTPKVVCEICGKAVRLPQLKVHQLRHRDERPYVCNQCGRSYKLINELNDHMRTHTGERPFTCQICGVSFTSSAYLRSHMMGVHSEKRPFQCEQCPSAFKTSTELKRHLHVHKGHKPLKCGQCEQVFFHDFSFKRHMMSHAGEKPFACSECDKAYTTHADLDRHVKKKHAGGTEEQTR